MLRRLFVPFVLIVSVLSACSSAPPGADPSTEDIVLGEGYEWEALNPLLGFGGEGASKLFDGLIKHDATLTVVPALAAEVPAAAPDGRSWTVRLRQGVTFHDGSAFDAEDVVATYRAVLNPVFASTIRSEFPMLTGVEKVDASTVRFDLAYPYALFANRLNLGIMPSEALAAPAPQESSPFNTAPIGTGPYKLAEWRKGSTMTLDANEAYFDGAPPVKKITIVFAEDDNTRAQQMRAGDLDATVPLGTSAALGTRTMTTPAPLDPALLDIEELSVRFLLGPQGRHGIVSAVTDISLQLTAGRILALVGESGCGKSVLAASLLGLLPANAEVRGQALLATGEGAWIELLGAPEQLLQSRVRGRLIGLVPQSAATHLTPVHRIATQLTEAIRELSAPPFGAEWRFRPRARRHSEPNGGATEELVRRAGLELDVLQRYPHELSGGMAQRVGVASALAGNPSVVLADEPTAGLDRPLVDRTVDQLAALAADGHAVLLITHDLCAARRVATDLAVMYASRIVEYGPADEMFSDPWHPYTRGLLAALPDRGFTAIPGDPPELTALPAGCAFRPRCPARAYCTNTVDLRRHDQRQLACHPAPC